MDQGPDSGPEDQGEDPGTRDEGPRPAPRPVTPPDDQEYVVCETGEGAPCTRVSIVDTEERLQMLARALGEAPAFAFDTETTRQEPHALQS